MKQLTCTCPEGYIVDQYGKCITLPPVKTGCETDLECDPNTACINAVCKDPCACGLNADCSIVDHKPVCTCKPNFYGDPKVECVTVGCTSDSECAETHACRLGDCTPVCGPDHWPCGGDAVCKGVSHQPTCRCPEGLTGDPYETCNAVECTDDSECPPTKACINKICQNTCAINNPCEETAVCEVVDHVVDCTCPAGTVGDRGTACVTGTKNKVSVSRK